MTTDKAMVTAVAKEIQMLHGSGLTVEEQAERIIASLSKRGEAEETPAPVHNLRGFTVKPLQWKQTHDGRYSDGLRPDHFTAENYTVHRISSGWVIDDGRFTFLRQNFASFDEATSVAQGHWTARIIAATTEGSDNG